MARRPDAGVPRDVFLRVRLTPDEAERLDRVRGEKSRSDFVRALIARTRRV